MIYPQRLTPRLRKRGRTIQISKVQAVRRYQYREWDVYPDAISSAPAASFTPLSAAAIQLFQAFGKLRVRTPGMSQEDRYRGHFVTLSQNSSSAIRGYPLPDLWGAPGWVYFAVAGESLGKVYLRASMTYQEMTVEFERQGNPPAVTRAIWDHGRFSRNAEHRGLESHFRMERKSGECKDGSFVEYDWITALNEEDILWPHHQLELALSYAVAKNEQDLGRLINFLDPVGPTSSSIASID
ncbi:hypothetical protein B0H14DRAFT_2827041 [Mycena olivaceomarginata]|nr:hypothetical protein B0H14DRAFT_2827041 [Mycena olivaceomarginata]